MPSTYSGSQTPLTAEILNLEIWEICKITGMRKVGGGEEFRVAWEPTWMPESDLGGAREVVDEFRARFSVLHGKNRQDETDAAGESLPKRRRGRS